MLVLSRGKHEKILIGEGICITVVAIRGDKVQIGITAPKEIPVNRLEVVTRSDELSKLHGLAVTS